jgi:hypothetical protein
MKGFALNKSMLMRPQYLPPSAWTGHLPFAFWLIEAAKPRVFVELGTHAGASYMGFCQSVKENGVGTKCFAVDTWKGDEHAGYYGDELYDALKLEHDSAYAAFSQLLRMTFDEAVARFNDNSVDGLHTYDAVLHDFTTWLPKMSEQGVILFHDTVVQKDDFGVWRLWRDLNSKFPAFEFTHEHGLGVLAVGSHACEAVGNLCKLSIERDRVLVNGVFEALGCGVKNEHLRAHFERTVVIRERTLAEMDEVAASQTKELDAVKLSLESAAEQKELLTRTIVSYEQRVQDLLSEKNELVGRYHEAKELAASALQKFSAELSGTIGQYELRISEQLKRQSDLEAVLEHERNESSRSLSQLKLEFENSIARCEQKIQEETLRNSELIAQIHEVKSSAECEFRKVTLEFDAKVEALNASLDSRIAKVSSLNELLAQSRKRADGFEGELARQIELSCQRVDELNERLAVESRRYEETHLMYQRELDSKNLRLNEVFASRSWQLTEPFRWFGKKISKAN